MVNNKNTKRIVVSNAKTKTGCCYKNKQTNILWLLAMVLKENQKLIAVSNSKQTDRHIVVSNGSTKPTNWMLLENNEQKHIVVSNAQTTNWWLLAKNKKTKTDCC